MAFPAMLRLGVRATFLTLVVSLVAGLAVRADADDVLPPDAALTQGLTNVDLAAPAPPFSWNDFSAYAGHSKVLSDADGALVFPAIGGTLVGTGLVNVFLIPATPYTAWFAALATANARGYKQNVASLDRRVRENVLYAQTTDAAGNFSFRDITPGSYYLFAELNLVFGTGRPLDTSERGVDANGHGTDVAVPEVDIPHRYVKHFVYLYGFTFAGDRTPWHLGELRNTGLVIEGRAADAPT
jgi:hypothetical protein